MVPILLVRIGPRCGSPSGSPRLGIVSITAAGSTSRCRWSRPSPPSRPPRSRHCLAWRPRPGSSRGDPPAGRRRRARPGRSPDAPPDVHGGPRRAVPHTDPDGDLKRGNDMTQGLASLAELIARTGLVDIEGLEVHVTIPGLQIGVWRRATADYSDQQRRRKVDSDGSVETRQRTHREYPRICR